MKHLNMNCIKKLFLDQVVPWMSYVGGQKVKPTKRSGSQRLVKNYLVRKKEKHPKRMIKFQNQLKICLMGRRMQWKKQMLILKFVQSTICQTMKNQISIFIPLMMMENLIQSMGLKIISLMV